MFGDDVFFLVLEDLVEVDDFQSKGGGVWFYEVLSHYFCVVLVGIYKLGHNALILVGRWCVSKGLITRGVRPQEVMERE